MLLCQEEREREEEELARSTRLEIDETSRRLAGSRGGEANTGNYGEFLYQQVSEWQMAADNQNHKSE